MPLIELPAWPRTCRNFIGGHWQEPSDLARIPVESPYTGLVIGSVPLSTAQTVDMAVIKAREAFEDWRRTPLKERSAILQRFRQLLLQNLDDLANDAALESGKTREEARAGLHKGIEVIDFALSLQNLDSGQAMDVSRGVSCETRREPLGVVAGITPFNFPAMVPLWLFPIAITVGNVFILKPSEKVPLTACRLGDLMAAAGYPPGVFSIVHGREEAVNAIIDHPDVKAVAFVGSTPVARAVYKRTSALGKRALALGGAKNHVIVVPDADAEISVKGIVDSFTGCAGQRCMAASLLIAVGPVDHLIEGVRKQAMSLPLGSCMGAIIDREAHERICRLIAEAQTDGAKILLDGRSAKPPVGYEGGFWLGPTIIDHARADMSCATTEIFGPVLTIVRARTLDEAMRLEARSPFGNATSVFTSRGAVARYVAERATAGMVGVNIGVPVPREPFSFGGTKASKFGHGDITGVASLDFWSDLKKITAKWALQPDATWLS